MAEEAAARALARVSTREHRFGPYAALLCLPENATALLSLAHGAGAGMRHAFMEAIAEALGRCRLATLRFEFPYVTAGSRRPDPRPVLLDTVCAAAAEAARLGGGLPLLAGGKSMGGRMTSLAAAEGRLEKVRGIVFFGFPLHPAGQPGTERAEHLARVPQPLLFLQGTRDALADLALLRPIVEALGPRARLRELEGADHGFHVRKRSGRTHEGVIEALAEDVVRFAAECSSDDGP
jgi:hypothetical protein